MTLPVTVTALPSLLCWQMVFPERMLRLRVEKTEEQGKWCAALEGAVGAIDHKDGVAQGKLLTSQRKVGRPDKSGTVG